MTRRERILITVKTYPALSGKYVETVCTAGVREDGSWIRLYPVPFRGLEEKEQYKKFDWIECGVSKNASDNRPESFRPTDLTELVVRGHMSTSNKWFDRRRLLLETCTVYEDMNFLIQAAGENKMSLAVFKPSRLLKFDWQEDDREWPQERLQQVGAHLAQQDMFDDEIRKETFEIIPKLPYKFLYHFEDKTGRKSRMSVLDWEIGALYWNCYRKNENEQEALHLVKQKYWDEFIQKDLHFFLGTTRGFHHRASNPWAIIGAFPIPHRVQTEMF